MSTTAHQLTSTHPGDSPLLSVIRGGASPSPGAAKPVPNPSLLAHRLSLACVDLGLDDVLPTGWITVTGNGARFEPLPPASLERLVQRLEDLADRLPPSLPLSRERAKVPSSRPETTPAAAYGAEEAPGIAPGSDVPRPTRPRGRPWARRPTRT